MNSKKTKRFSIPALIIFALIFFLIIAYLFSSKSISLTLPTNSPMSIASPIPTIDPTANWKAYEGKLYGYNISFKYPQSWFFNNCGQTVLLNQLAKPDCKVKFYPIQITQEETSWRYGYIQYWKEKGFEVERFVGGFPADSSEKYQIKNVKTTLLPTKFNTYLIAYSLETAGHFTMYNYDLKYEEIADQILSTFKFTK